MSRETSTEAEVAELAQPLAQAAVDVPPELSLAIPLYNEADNVESVVSSLVAALEEAGIDYAAAGARAHPRQPGVWVGHHHWPAPLPRALPGIRVGR